MSVFLMTSSFVTTLLIPPEQFEPGGERQRPRPGLPGPRVPRQRLRHASTTSPRSRILWFAGASAMAGLLNLLPRYLPRYGMAPRLGPRRTPDGARLHRHRVPRHLDLRRRRRRPGRRVRHRRPRPHQLGRRRRDHRRVAGRRTPQTVAFGVIALIFLYTTVANVVERPDGVKIAPASSPASSWSRCSPGWAGRSSCGSPG